MKTKKTNYFEENLGKANNVLKVIGLQTDENDNNRNLFQRIRNRWYYCFFYVMLFLELAGEIGWFIKGIIIKSSIIELTFTAPCATLCFVGQAKDYYTLKYAHHINDLITTLRALHSEGEITMNEKLSERIRKLEKTYSVAVNSLVLTNVAGLIAFMTGPILLTWYRYQNTGELHLMFPFRILYPFNAQDLRVYPWVYIHQVVGGIFAVFTVLGPDCLYYLFCTYIQAKFCVLKYEAERITASCNIQQRDTNESFRSRIRKFVMEHQELIRCVNLVEVIYSKSTLFNCLTSSLLICLAGFNIMAYENLGMLGNFLTFFVMSLLQIYLYCYFGDNLSRASMEMSDGIYNSKWFIIEAKKAKDLLIILRRAQKPCKLTAYGFADINLAAFTRILSTAWSYFALLKSMFNRK